MKKLIPLKPIQAPVKEMENLEEIILEAFRKYFFGPLLKELREDKSLLQNAADDLAAAIRKGKVVYYRGKFLGKVNAKMSREIKALGGKFDSREKAWKLPAEKLSFRMKEAIESSDAKFNRFTKKMDDLLEKFSPEEMVKKIKFQDVFKTILGKTEDAFQSSIKGIIVEPRLSESRLARIAEDYTWNLKLDIKTFTAGETAALRERMKKRVFSGLRYEGVIETLQHRYRVSKSKARFWASQETRLLTSTYKEERYREAGVKWYKWNCVIGSPLHPVRPRHKELGEMSKKGKLFRYDQPPISSEPGKPVRRNNPHRDYNCRCFDIPVVEF